MARKLKFEEAEVDTVSAADPVEDDLAAAEQATADTEEGLVETEAQFGNRLAALEASVAELLEQNRRLAALVRQNAEMTQVLQRNIKRLAGEPVVTERVSKAAAPAMEELTFAHPAPRYQMDAPAQHVTERRADGNRVLPTDDGRTAAAKRNMTRANIVRGSVGG